MRDITDSGLPRIEAQPCSSLSQAGGRLGPVEAAEGAESEFHLVKALVCW